MKNGLCAYKIMTYTFTKEKKKQKEYILMKQSIFIDFIMYVEHWRIIKAFSMMFFRKHLVIPS